MIPWGMPTGAVVDRDYEAPPYDVPVRYKLAVLLAMNVAARFQISSLVLVIFSQRISMFIPYVKTRAG